MDDLTSRALRAYYRAGDTTIPSSVDSGPVTDEGKKYVVLRNVNGTLAVYRHQNSGQLRRLKRWPQGLDVY
ncbi:hypothetical protein [Streptomyces sp. NPDC047974]|uniref:hypothetical protein n=1 Tax=Streptomyces sp. NPDC047974 TaxID=3154343 RepID=UPI0033E2ED7B